MSVTMDYQKQATDFLAAHGLEFRSVLIGDDCPRFCEDSTDESQRQTEYRIGQFPRKNHIHGRHYRCTISGKDRGHVSFDFWNSYADEEFNYYREHDHPKDNGFMDRAKRRKQPKRTPTAYDLLACLQKYDPGTFKDFCSDFGYNDDSIKAFDVYRAVQDEYSKLRRFFTPAELEEIQEIS